jgi:transcriptional regulator with XRE-family HTH domain
MVDPNFGATLRRLREGRRLSLRRLGKLVSYSHTQVWELEVGKTQPTLKIAAALDAALDADGALAAMVTEDHAPTTPDDDERLNRLVCHPQTVDPAAVDSFGVILAHQRRLEDRIGSGALLAPVVSQLAVIENVVIDARGPIRPAVIGVAAQWAQFAGWLSSSSHRPADADQWLTRALEWATEVGDRDMIATVLSFKGHVAWTLGQLGPMISLSAAAQRDEAVYVEQRAFSALQEARGHAMAGDATVVERKLGEAAELIAIISESDDPLPPWSYYYRSPGFFDMVRGLVHRYLGRTCPAENERAIEALEAGRAAQPADMRESDWAGQFIFHTAVAYAQAGDVVAAQEALEKARRIAIATGSSRLGSQVAELAHRLGL